MEEARKGEVEQILRMAGGDGEYSYASNSSGQRKLIVMTKSILENVLEQMYKKLLLERITIVDLGCSSGPNTLLVLSQVLDVISKLHEQSKEETTAVVPEIQFILNDLPSNDFNSVFRSLEEFKRKMKEEERGNLLLVPYYVAAVSGSFHGRLFPSSTVHFFYSSNSLQWLSQVPKELESALNKGNIYFTPTSPPWIIEAYREQFRQDFSMFLKSRFEELSVGGGALLTITGRADVDGNLLIHIAELFSDSLNAMAEEGIISKAKLDAFDLPFYSPSLEEAKSIILSESSFCIEQAQLFSNKWHEFQDDLRDGKKIANSFRAATESLFSHHFGDAILDELYERFAEKVSRSIAEGKLTDCDVSHIVIVLKKEKNTPR